MIGGGRSEAAPASSLQPVTEVWPFRNYCDVFRAVFMPDEPVAAVSADGIYTKGHRRKSQGRRGGGGRHRDNDAMTPSIPATAAEAEWI